ncbi:MAG: nucleotide-binding protein [Candidatus Nitrosotenuis sp.]|nr:MAG: nucleotide-binding protein [Candidatus Nitrosotenuis sp.]
MQKANCAYCGNETELPFECNYCKDPFCSDHRLPEEHRCVKLSQIRAKRFGQKGVIREQKGGFLRKIFRRRKN